MHKIQLEEIFDDSLRGQLEKFLESDKMTSQLTKALLVVAVFGGIFFIGATAPNLFSALGRMKGKSNRISKDGFQKIRQGFYQLRRRKVIQYVKTENGVDIYRITKKGREELKKFSFDNLLLPKPRRWDRKWRLVIFDIPQTKRQARDLLRDKLRDLGFFQLQKSVWVHPFPCKDEIFYIADIFNLRPHIEVLTVEDFDNVKALNYFEGELEDFFG